MKIKNQLLVISLLMACGLMSPTIKAMRHAATADEAGMRDSTYLYEEINGVGGSHIGWVKVVGDDQRHQFDDWVLVRWEGDGSYPQVGRHSLVFVSPAWLREPLPRGLYVWKSQNRGILREIERLLRTQGVDRTSLNQELVFKQHPEGKNFIFKNRVYVDSRNDKNTWNPNQSHPKLLLETRKLASQRRRHSTSPSRGCPIGRISREDEERIQRLAKSFVKLNMRMADQLPLYDAFTNPLVTRISIPNGIADRYNGQVVEVVLRDILGIKRDETEMAALIRESIVGSGRVQYWNPGKTVDEWNDIKRAIKAAAPFVIEAWRKYDRGGSSGVGVSSVSRGLSAMSISARPARPIISVGTKFSAENVKNSDCVNDTQCPICMDDWSEIAGRSSNDERTIVKICGNKHYTCLPCLKRLVQSRADECPICREELQETVKNVGRGR